VGVSSSMECSSGPERRTALDRVWPGHPQTQGGHAKSSFGGDTLR
jgi:hypothetical protein